MNITPKLDHISTDFITQYLTSLGIDNIKSYLKPTKSCFEKWNKYSNIERACEFLKTYIDDNENIGIIIDSDTDGSCSAALMYNFLKFLGHDKIKIYYHKGKQHGLKDLIDQIIAENGNYSLLIIPDAGTNDKDECRELMEHDIQVLILDHHVVEVENPYAIIVNNQIGEVKNKYLSGTGVTDKFVRAYCDIFNYKYPDYCDLVAVSLVSDICNLTSLDNRAYMHFGLTNLTNPFLSFLFEKLCSKKGYNSESIGWDISPLNNALARSEEQESKTLFFKGLVGEIEPEKALKEMRRIKRIQDAEVKEIVNKIEPNLDFSRKVIIDFTEPSNASFLGLIANKFTGKYRKPTILLRESNSTTWSGSLRSPVPLLTKINQSGLAKAQGHEEACGVFIKKSNLKRFEEWLNSLNLSEKPNIEVTACANPKDISLNLCDIISQNKILWGKGIENPTFYISFDINRENVYVFNKTTTTLKLDLQGLSCLKFFASENDIKEFMQYDNFHVNLVVGNLSINEYNGYKTPQCEIIDYEIIKNDILKNGKENWEDLF